MQLLDMILSASKGMREVSMPERKDIATVKDQRDYDKMGIQKLMQKTRDRSIEVVVEEQLYSLLSKKEP